MRLFALLFGTAPLLLTGCFIENSELKDGGGEDLDGDDDDDDDDDDGGDCAASETTVSWVVEHLAVLDEGAGTDIDGDGAPDNAGSVFGDVMADAIELSRDRDHLEIVVQLWDVDDWCDDDEVMGGMASVEDTDGDPDDNYSGEETFSGGDNVDSEGRAHYRTELTLEGGEYDAEIDDQATFAIGDYDFAIVSPVVLTGEVEADEHDGVFAFAVDLRSTRAPSQDAGVSEGQIESLLDYDSDGDDVPDALSMAFGFSAVRAEVEE